MSEIDSKKALTQTVPQVGGALVRAGLSFWLALVVLGCAAGGETPSDDSSRATAEAAEAAEQAARDEGRDAWVPADEIGTLYSAQCGVCHGAGLEGASQGPALVGRDLEGGDSVLALAKSIAEGAPRRGMPTWGEVLSPEEIRSLAVYVREKRAKPPGPNDYGTGELPEIPKAVQQTEKHAFRIAPVAEGRTFSYSIAPLPDGRVLLTERARGLVLLTPNGEGEVAEILIEGTPRAYADGTFQGSQFTGIGWLLDVELHPDYASNGWVYLSYGDRCDACNDASRASGKPVSMVALARGRLRNGRWVDAQTLWTADRAYYSDGTELGAGARITFDGKGYVYLSIGAKGDYAGAQKLASPDGKIIRLHEDGRIPADNPFAKEPGALAAVWSYGHRNPQGLVFHPATGLLWESEHGPRGGDELNVIEPGRNYGWPVQSAGIDYDGSPIRDKWNLGVDLATIEHHRKEWTPSIGVSSLAAHRGGAFAEWKDDLLLATLSRNQLIRLALDGREVVGEEILVDGLSRIRDVEVGADGRVYLLLEHNKGTRIVRLDPA
jgi:glucose/arabinose dehydrogenase/cytochrome c5